MVSTVSIQATAIIKERTLITFYFYSIVQQFCSVTKWTIIRYLACGEYFWLVVYRPESRRAKYTGIIRMGNRG